MRHVNTAKAEIMAITFVQTFPMKLAGEVCCRSVWWLLTKVSVRLATELPEDRRAFLQLPNKTVLSTVS